MGSGRKLAEWTPANRACNVSKWWPTCLSCGPACSVWTCVPPSTASSPPRFTGNALWALVRFSPSGYSSCSHRATTASTTSCAGGLLSYQARARMRTVKKRACRDRPERREDEVYFEMQVQRDEGAIKQRSQGMGWQVYASNGGRMSLEQVVWAYRGQYRIEDDWSRLKGRPLGLTPMYLQK